jgi:CRP/FNR family transcriptional regulator, cyclic AMP receptor protein
MLLLRNELLAVTLQAAHGNKEVNGEVAMKSVIMDPIIERFLESCRFKRFEAKSRIIQQGDVADKLFYILKGSVRVLLQLQRGHEIVLAYLNAGEFFGELGLFNHHAKRSASVYARTSCEIAYIEYEELRSLPIYPELVPAIASQTAMRLKKHNRKVGDLAFASVSGRIFRTLVDLCKEPEAMTHLHGTQIRITRQELGRIVGCSREMAGRTLKRLEKQHLISARGKTIVVFGERRRPQRSPANRTTRSP